MKNIINKIIITVFFTATFSSNISAQNVSKVKGTIGKEKSNDMIVICVLGTKACLPLVTNESMKTLLNGELTSLKDLPTGIYIEVDLKKTDGKNLLKSISTDINKTVICFLEINEKIEQELISVLEKTSGVNNYTFYDSSSQVLIDYNHAIIDYKELKNTIIDAGFKIE
jgi:hypothetical protein